MRVFGSCQSHMMSVQVFFPLEYHVLYTESFEIEEVVFFINLFCLLVPAPEA